MNRPPAWLPLSLALLAACDGASTPPGTHVDCAWFTGANCWKATAAAATACTDALATGTFDGATTTCTYGDGNVVQFDPAASATASLHQDVPWSFTVLDSSAATCARVKETATSSSVTTHLGTFSETSDARNVSITCPDGSQVWTELGTALGCGLADLPGFVVGGSSPVQFSLLGAPVGDTVLWRCQ